MKRFYDAVLTKLNLAYFFFLLIQPLCSAKISHEVGHNYCNKRAQNRLFTLLKPSWLCEPTALEKILVMGRGISLKARIEPSVTEYQEQHEQSYFTIPLCYHKLLQISYYSYYGWSVHRGERRGGCVCVFPTLLRMISGARYSGVPQRVQVRPFTLFANPKSVIYEGENKHIQMRLLEAEENSLIDPVN